MNRRSRRLRTGLLLAAALLIAGMALAADAGDVLRRADLSSVDRRFDLRGKQSAPDVILVKIDDRTLNEPGVQWPLDRRWHASVIRQLARAGAASIVYDVQFTEPGPDPDADDALIRASRRAAPRLVLATTEVGLNGSTRIFGGGEALEYTRAAPANGNVRPDFDGRVRRMPFEIQELTSLSIAGVRAAGRAGKEPLPGGTAWIDFPGGPDTVRGLSFGDVRLGRFNPDLVRGKLVLVGATAPSLQDRHPTATSGDYLMPGPEIHAAAMQTAVDGFPLESSPRWLDVLLIVLLAMIAPLAAIRLRMSLAIGVGVLSIVALLGGAQLAFNDGMIVTVVYALMAGFLALLATAAIHGITVAFERAHTLEAFGRFVPEAVVQEVMRSADGARLGGVQRVGTVMFSDLRGFTSFAETLEPAQVIDALNRYLTEMSEAILHHGGTLVAYMGDGIMAVFGAPLAMDDHADRGVAAAREMLDRLEGFNQWLRDEGLHEGFKMGIGLNTGPVMSGHVGSERRLEYTALGDTTNTAARLEGMTKGTPHQLYVADSTRAALSAVPEDLVPVGEFEVRGRQATIKLWSLADAAVGERPGAVPAPPAVAAAGGRPAA